MKDQFLNFMKGVGDYKTGPYQFHYEEPGKVTMTDQSTGVVYHFIAKRDPFSKCVWGAIADDCLGFRICDGCGRPMVAGYSDNLNYYCSEEELETALAREYGKHWKRKGSKYEYLDRKAKIWKTTNYERKIWTKTEEN